MFSHVDNDSPEIDAPKRKHRFGSAGVGSARTAPSIAGDTPSIQLCLSAGANRGVLLPRSSTNAFGNPPLSKSSLETSSGARYAPS
jgi:hypothetical protein